MSRQVRGDLPEPVRRYFNEVEHMQPPNDLMDAAVAEIHNAPKPHRFSPIVTFGLGAAVAAAGMLALIVFLPGLREVAIPNATAPPSDSQVPSASPTPAQSTLPQSRYLITLGSVLLGYDDYADWPASTEAREKGIGFEPAWDEEVHCCQRVGEPPPYLGPGLSYGWMGDRWAENGYGVVIADVTGAGYHQKANDRTWHADNAEDFLNDLASLPLVTGGNAYEVGEIQPAELAGWPALSAHLRTNEGNSYPFLEDFAADNSGHLAPTFQDHYVQDLIVADVGDSIVLVQIWAADEQTLAEWLPKARAFLSTMHIQPAN